eukprot:SAG22_NODE_294_length_12872_cov_47.391372_9_plen_210_part_00
MSEPLPPGWEQHFDESQNRHYWWNEETEESSWERPQPAAAAAAAASPPPAPPSGMKSFLDPNMAAGFPRTMREEGSTGAKLANDFMAADQAKTVALGDASIAQAADDGVADFLAAEAEPSATTRPASLSGGAQKPSTQDMSAVEDSEDNLYDDSDDDEDAKDEPRVLETPGEVDRCASSRPHAPPPTALARSNLGRPPILQIVFARSGH